jgi:hypothetical protein
MSGVRDRRDDGALPALDARDMWRTLRSAAPPDGALGLPREQRHSPYLAQVPADGIVPFVERSRRQPELLCAFGAIEHVLVARVLLVRVDDLDARATEASNRSSSSSEDVMSDGSSSLTSSYNTSLFLPIAISRRTSSYRSSIDKGESSDARGRIPSFADAAA